MNLRLLYLSYGAALIILGLVGYFLTFAKSALISGLVSGLIMLIMGFLVERIPFVKIIAKVFNILFLAAFAWRSTIAMSALAQGAGDKLIPSILLSLMALVSVGVFALSILVKKRVKQDGTVEN